MVRRVLTLMLVLAVVLSMAACGQTEKKEAGPAGDTKNGDAAQPTKKDPTELTGKLTIWNWNNPEQNEATRQTFNKRFPKVELEYVNVASADYVTKIQTAVAAGTELPDVVWTEAGQRGTLFAMDFLDDLTKAPYNLDKNAIDPRAIGLVEDEQGRILALPSQMNPSGMAYRRSTVKAVLGTDDPDEISKMLPTWDAVIEKFKDAKLNGEKVYAFRTVRDIFHMVDGANTVNPIQNGTIKYKEVYLPTFQLIEKLYKSGVIGDLDMWTPEWNSSFPDKHYAFAASAPWFCKYIVEPNDPEGKGDWGIAVPPGGMFNWGGMAKAIANDCKDKEIAWEYIKDEFFNKDGAKTSFETGTNLIPNKEFINTPGFFSKKEEYWGGQDLGQFFIDHLDAFKVKKLGKYDAYLEANFVLGLNLLQEGKTAEECIDAMIEDMKLNHPELKVE